MQRHINSSFSVSEGRCAFRFDMLHCEFLRIYEQFFLIMVILLAIQGQRNLALHWKLQILFLRLKIRNLTKECTCLSIVIQLNMLRISAQVKDNWLKSSVCETCPEKCHLSSPFWRSQCWFKICWTYPSES